MGVTFNKISNNPSDAIKTIYEDHFDRLFSYANAITDSKELAKDVVSEFFYGLLKNNTDLSQVHNLEVYLCVGIKNLCLKHLKKLPGTHRNSVLLATVDFVDPQQVLMGNELKKLLDNLIDDLPDQCQLIFRMSKERGMKNQEIADELQIGMGTVKTQLRRAQTKLKAGITTHYKESNADYTPWRLIGMFLLIAFGV